MHADLDSSFEGWHALISVLLAAINFIAPCPLFQNLICRAFVIDLINGLNRWKLESKIGYIQSRVLNCLLSYLRNWKWCGFFRTETALNLFWQATIHWSPILLLFFYCIFFKRIILKEWISIFLKKTRYVYLYLFLFKSRSKSIFLYQLVIFLSNTW